MATGATQPFRPAGTVAVAASTSAVTAALSGGGSALLIYNAASSPAFVRLGAAAGLTATNADTPVPPGSRMLLDASPFVSHAAVVLSDGAGMVYFTLGHGDTY
ncbi:hypothetical protein [Acidocella sp.]|uniref:hypothetical protein n=1 Tax=Acidocella sp. TaxID=50710 RepID=UPI00260A7521|nr:hypothetical protein [Acidocella sp.]